MGRIFRLKAADSQVWRAEFVPGGFRLQAEGSPHIIRPEVMRPMKISDLLSSCAKLGLCALLLAARGDLAAQTNAAPDREYTLISTMLGYRGVGGDIDGIRNPTLWARTGETVRLTIVNGELMVHDIALEKLEVKSTQILDKGATASITFKAKASDTYFCSLPGHRAAGMEGRLEVSDAPRTSSPGVAPAMNGRPLNLDFEAGTLDNWTASGDAFELVQGEATPEQAAEKRSGVRGH